MIKVVLSALVVFWFLPGCSSLGRAVLAPPQASLVAVGLKEITAVGATVVFSVRVENPNAYALKVNAVRYEVLLNDQELSRGRIDQPQEVPGKGQSVIDIPVPVLYRDLFARLTDLLAKKASRYYIKGDADFGVVTVPFESRGELTIGT